MSVYDEVATALKLRGLLLRGGFHATPEDGLPEGAGTVLMVGNAGPDLWRVFPHTPEADDGQANGLDRWTRRVMTQLAEAFGARAILPFDGPPYAPFQRWAQRAEPVAPSPIGILIHPVPPAAERVRGQAVALALVGRREDQPRVGPAAQQQSVLAVRMQAFGDRSPKPLDELVDEV